MTHYPSRCLSGHRIAWRTLSGIACGRVTAVRGDIALVGSVRVTPSDIIRVYN